MMARHLWDEDDAAEDSTDAVAGFIVVLVVGILGALAIVHWLDCSTQDSAALCLGPVMMRLQHLRWRWADRAWQTVRVLCLRAQLRWEVDALDNMQEAHDQLPHDMALQRRSIGALRAELIISEAAARGKA